MKIVRTIQPPDRPSFNSWMKYIKKENDKILEKKRRAA